MTKRTGLIAAILAILAVVAGLSVAVFYSVDRTCPRSESPEGENVLRSRVKQPAQRLATARQRRMAIRERLEGMRSGFGTNEVQSQISIMEEMERLEEGELSKFQWAILKELNLALLQDDKRMALQKIHQFIRLLSSSVAMSAATRVRLSKHIVKALGWLGAEGIPELTPFLADESPEVREMAMNQFEQALMDFSLGDRDVSQIVIAAAQVLTDKTSLEDIMFNIDFRMRHSVGVETMLEISRSGTDAAREVLGDEILFFTGDDTIVTDEDLINWLDKHPDNMDDEEIYGAREALK